MSKLVIILLAVMMIQANGSPDQPEEECLEIEDVSLEEASTIIHTKIPKFEDQSNKKLTCFAACMIEQMNITHGCSFQYELGKQHVLGRKIYDEDLVNSLDICKDSAQGKERCECGYNVYKCITDYFISLRGKGSNKH
ncbi:uncharacterized protein LOC129917854 [Episyrphus balteatus]|uniref:uncharacterized protein LOC129917854 n=1 Tax=Episyrphus balteatus TaxID=286459 RepID=UPI002485725E|nr:uncharacterized protein LOC129917854 [Episyrphus balteatus]